MAVFSRSVFQSLMDRIADEAPPAEDDEVPSATVRGLKAGLVFETGQSISSPAAAGSAYRDLDFAREIEPVPMPAHLGRLSVDEVAADLGISPDASASDLARLRRSFARLNHPDQVDPEHSGKANIRMMLANRLIDEALARLAQARSG